MKYRKAVIGLIFLWISCLTSAMEPPVVTVAGFAFSGDYKSAAERFPYTFKHFESGRANPEAGFSRMIVDRMKAVNNPALTFNTRDMVGSKNSDQALMAILVLTDEIVANENFGGYYKTFLNLRGNAMIFDNQSNILIRNYPISVVLFDATEGENPPTDAAISVFVEALIRRPDGSGLISQFVKKMEKATLPGNFTKTVQVKQGEVTPEALALLPESLRNNPSAANSMVADAFASVLAARSSLAILPNSIGHVNGIMNLRLESGDDYQVKIAEGDYLFDVKLNKLVKKKYKETPAEVAWLYGASASIKFYEPNLNTTFFESEIRNTESATIPAGKISGDDFAAYSDAIVGLFKKFSEALNTPGTPWIITATSNKDIESQLSHTRKQLDKSK
jgi:hypothetical protein